jgi:hypothetical protein
MSKFFLSLQLQTLVLCLGVVLFAAPSSAQPATCGGIGPAFDVLLKKNAELLEREVRLNEEDRKQSCTAKKLELFVVRLDTFKQALTLNERGIRAGCPMNAANTQAIQHLKNLVLNYQWRVSTCANVLGVDPNFPRNRSNRTGASTPYPFDCSRRPPDANVSWYYSCNPPEESANLRRTAYRHPITPQQLYSKAYALCRSTPLEQQRACIADAKKNALRTEDSTIRARCGSLSGDQQVHCVERYYLFGPDAGSAQNARAYVQQEIDYQNRIENAYELRRLQSASENNRQTVNNQRQRENTQQESTGSDSRTHNAPRAEIERIAQENAPAPLPPAQQLFDRVVRASVDVATEANKAMLNENDQKECAVAAYKAAWIVMSGLSRGVTPAKCSGVVADTLAQLAYQAAAQFSANPPPEEDLLKHYLGLHYANTKGKNDGTLDAPFEAQGLTPGTDAPR